MIIGCKLATTEYGAKTFFQSQLVTDESDKFNPPITRPLNMLNIIAHYSFDYAQQVL